MDIVKLCGSRLSSPAGVGSLSPSVTCPASSDRLIATIQITDAIAIEDREVEESFVRAAGPGGQNVNKVATAVQRRFDIRRSPSLPHDVRARLEQLAGRRLTQEGVLKLRATSDHSDHDQGLLARSCPKYDPRGGAKPKIAGG